MQCLSFEQGQTTYQPNCGHQARRAGTIPRFRTQSNAISPRAVARTDRLRSVQCDGVRLCPPPKSNCALSAVMSRHHRALTRTANASAIRAPTTALTDHRRSCIAVPIGTHWYTSARASSTARMQLSAQPCAYRYEIRHLFACVRLRSNWLRGMGLAMVHAEDAAHTARRNRRRRA